MELKEPRKQSHEASPAVCSHPHVPWGSALPGSPASPRAPAHCRALCLAGPPSPQELGSQMGSLDVNGFCISSSQTPEYHPCHFRRHQHKPRFKPSICLFSVFIKEGKMKERGGGRGQDD